MNNNLTLHVTVGIVVLSVNEFGYLFIHSDVDREDLVGICEQLMAEQRGLA